MTNVVHWDDLEPKQRSEGDIDSRWRLIGEAAGTVGVGLRRIEIKAGCRSTPAHAHGAEEEIFWVLGGSGQLWQDGAACEVHPGDCIVHEPEGAAHTLRAGDGGLDVLAFGTRVKVEICHLPRAGMAWAGPTVVAAPGLENLWAKDASQGPMEFPFPSPRPANIAAIDRVEAEKVHHGRSRFAWKSPGHVAGARASGLNHMAIEPDAHGWPPHCHGAEEEIFVVLEGSGTVTLGGEETAVRPGHVVARPPGTGVAHQFRAGSRGMSLLCYGTHVPNDIAYFPRSRKVFFRGIGVVGRLEAAGYWEGEE